MAVARFGIRAPDAATARSYRDRLRRWGLLTSFHDLDGGRGMNLPVPVGVPSEIIAALMEGNRLAQRFLAHRFQSAGALREHYERAAPCVAGQRVLPAGLAALRHRQIADERFNLPLANDALVTAVGPRVVEIQSCLPPSAETEAEFMAARREGFAVPEEVRHAGTAPAGVAFHSLRRALVGPTGQVFVADVGALDDGSVYDRLIQAHWLGGEDAPLLDLSRIDGDAAGEPIFQTRRGPLRAADLGWVYCRATPQEVAELEQRFIAADEERRVAALARFLGDDRIRWAWHPADTTLLDKRSLRPFRDWLLAEGEAFAECVPRCHGPGESAPAGRYAVKPVDGNSARGLRRVLVIAADASWPQEYVAVNEIDAPGREVDVTPAPDARIDPPVCVDRVVRMESGKDGWTVPGGDVAQEIIVPMPVPVEVPACVSAGRCLDATLEVRSMSYPGTVMSQLFGYRLAPRADVRGRPVPTNLAPAMRAYDEYILRSGCNEEQRAEAEARSPFGFGAAWPVPEIEVVRRGPRIHVAAPGIGRDA